VLAQEEFSKAFILQLVADGALPWINAVRQSISKHQCKHLLAIVMDWLPNIYDWLETYEQRKAAQLATEAEFRFPSDVATALNIYRHEEIERIRSGDPWKATIGRRAKLARSPMELLTARNSRLFMSISPRMVRLGCTLV
jgi:hypothetical protein